VKPKDELKLEAIARAAYACVLERGLSALTLADIARQAGLATSTLYVYYPAKQALLNALYERAKTVTFARLIDGDSEQLPTKARVRLIWQHLLDLRLDNLAEAVFMEQYASSEYMSEPNRALSARLVAVFNALLERGQKEETLKAVPLPFLAGTVSASVQEIAKLIQQQVLPNDEATRATGFQLCWDAIKA
jgi:TetR/AcrR family transcriptional repressor of multidrug resistance operon